MAKFMLLLHEPPGGMDGLSPEEIQSVIQEYSAWAAGLAERDQHAGGGKLTNEGGRLLSKEGGELRVVDGPYTEAKEVMGGFFMVLADDYDEAVTIAQGCPHLRHGRIEIRQIDPAGE